MTVRGRTPTPHTMEFYDDETGQVLMAFDGTAETVTVPAGATLVGGAGSIVVSAPDGITLDTSGAGSSLEVKAAGVAASRLAPTVHATANGAVVPGSPVVIIADLADHATQNVDLVPSLGIDVTDVRVISTGTNGANANTFQVDNGTGGNHITAALAMSGKVAGDVVDAVTLDPTHYSVIAGATLRIVQTRAGGVAAARIIIKGFLNGL